MHLLGLLNRHLCKSFFSDFKIVSGYKDEAYMDGRDPARQEEF